MKTNKINVQCYIYETFNERGTKRFENNVMLFLKRNGISGNIICHNAYMRGQGRGSYLKFADIEINGIDYTLAEHTHNSELWDNWENPTSKDKRNLFLAVLSDKVEGLKQAINEEND